MDPNTVAWQAVGRSEDLAEGGMLAVEIAGTKIAVYRVDGQLFATDNICSHAYAMLTDGWLDGDEIECPLHGGRFNVRTGKAMTSPVECDIRTFPVREADGIIAVLPPQS
ncbi:MAG TPA: non-heme iron oxygenase ferredoxin subunit [Pseudolabrys sp.]|nr:non-heme iron oxygenase ferredoxin subunit [Pseudolabrys sp.]